MDTNKTNRVLTQTAISANEANFIAKNTTMGEHCLRNFNAQMRLIFSYIRLAAMRGKYYVTIPCVILFDVDSIDNALKIRGYQTELCTDYTMEEILIIKWGGNTND